MTFNCHFSMFSTCVRYFPLVLSAVPRESAHVIEMHKLLRKDTDLHVSRYDVRLIRGHPLR